MLLNLLEISTRRAQLLQRTLTVFYLSIGLFVSTTVSIGLIAAAGTARYAGLPVVLGLIGSCFLCYGSALLIIEARLAVASTRKEMDFIWQLSQHYSPHESSRDHSTN